MDIQRQRPSDRNRRSRSAQVPEPIAAEALKTGKLVQVLEPFAPMTPGVFLYYPSRRQIMPKLRAFIDHVKRRRGDLGNVAGET